MNLLAKSLGQLAMLAVALFFFSCEDPTSIGIENPSEKFDVFYVDIPLGTKSYLVDSIVTDNLTGSSPAIYLGNFYDPELGSTVMQPFFQFKRTRASKLDGSPFIFDSATVDLRLNLYTYGISGTTNMTLSVHEITSEPLDFFFTSTQRYYNFSTFGYDPTPLATKTLAVDYTAIEKAKNDTNPKAIKFQARLDQGFAERLYADLTTNTFNNPNLTDTDRTNDSITPPDYIRFYEEFKGLTVVPQTGNGIIGLYLFDISGVTMYYHKDGDTTSTTTTYGFNSVSFTNITTERPAEIGNTPYQSIDPANGHRYIQNGTGALTRLDLSNFYEFARQDSVKDILINSAKLTISDINYSTGSPPHSLIGFRLSDYSNHPVDSTFAADSLKLAREYVLPTTFFVPTDLQVQASDVASIGFDSTQSSYVGYLTRFFHHLAKNVSDDGALDEKRIKYITLMPLTPQFNRGINTTVFHKDNINLRIHYTKPKNLNK